MKTYKYNVWKIVLSISCVILLPDVSIVQQWPTPALFSTGSTNFFQEASIPFQHIIPEVIVLFVELRPFPPHIYALFCRILSRQAFTRSLFFPCQQSFFLASSLFSFPCLSFFLALFEPNSEFHPWVLQGGRETLKKEWAIRSDDDVHKIVNLILYVHSNHILYV